MNNLSDIIGKIYNSEYFVPALFILIVILAIIFLILVFSGKKKKDVNETNSNNNGLEKNLETINNANGVNEQPIQNVVLQEDPVVAPTVDPVEAAPTLESNPVEQPKDVFSAPVVEAPQSIETSIPTEPVTQVSQPMEPSIEPSVPVAEDVPTTEPIVEPVMETPVVESPSFEPTPVEMSTPVEPIGQENNDLFNTSIFHDMPTDLENAPVDTPENSVVEQPEVEANSSLFEPAPDLDVAIPMDTALTTPVEENVPTIETPVVESPSFEPTPVEMSTPVEPVVDLPKTEYQERVVQPTQFSSVYINKEEPEVAQPTAQIPNENKVPPYDPTLFERKFEPVPEITPVMPEAEVTPVIPVVENEVETPENPSMDSFFAFPSTPEPEVEETSIDIPTTNTVSAAEEMEDINSLPALDPMENIDVNPLKEEEPVVKVNPKNTFDFELPSLAKETQNNDNATTNTNNNFPNVSGETYDIE